MAADALPTVPSDLCEPVVTRLQELAAALDGPAAHFDDLLAGLFDDLRGVAGAVGALPRAA